MLFIVKNRLPFYLMLQNFGFVNENSSLDMEKPSVKLLSQKDIVISLIKNYL